MRTRASLRRFVHDTSNPSESFADAKVGAEAGTDVIPTGLAPQRSSLLDLPDELLTNIVQEVAPLGGWKAHNCRLVCRRLCVVATPVTFASIQIPTQHADPDDAFFACLLGNGHDIKACATSIAYHILPGDNRATPAAAIKSLVNLRRVSLSSPFTSHHDRVELSDAVEHALTTLPHLDTLAISSVNVKLRPWEGGSLLARCPRVRNLALEATNDDGVYSYLRVGSGPVEFRFPPNGVETLEIYHPGVMTGSYQTRYIMNALYSCAKTVREIVLEWKDDADFNDVDGLSMNDGLESLFNAEINPDGHLRTCAFMLTFLDWVGKSSLSQLSLPISTTFDLHPALLNLRMPNVHHLRLASCPRTPYSEKPDLLNSTTYPYLVAFLTSSIFPHLETIHLVGWLDASDITTLVDVPPKNLVCARSPLLPRTELSITFEHESKLLQGAAAGLRAQSALIETELAAPSVNFSAINSAALTLKKVTGALQLHFIYFNSLAPISYGGGDTSKASPAFASQVKEDFGSFDNLIASLDAEVLAVPASGWGFLAWDTQVKSLVITFTNGEDLLDAPLIPIIDVDIFEHAFIIDTGANKTEYLDNLKHIYNWEFASAQFAAAINAYH
ncbi:superoxide dismutase, Fe-Mn family, partial [Phenoliferia sp. Uapishka_3]